MTIKLKMPTLAILLSLIKTYVRHLEVNEKINLLIRY